MQWRPNSDQSQGRRPALRGVLDGLLERAAPFIEGQPEFARPAYGSVFRSGPEMLPGVGDVVAVEDLQTAAQNNDWGGIGLGLLAALPGIPAIGKGARARRGLSILDDAAPAQTGGLMDGMGRTEAESALARYQAANPADTGARVLNPGDEGYPTNAQWDEASQAYVAPRADAPPVEPDYPIRAYHGSPHSFDQFELSPRTIGTGEGAQAYGHGLYFAENEGIARGYRDAAVDPDSVPLQFRGKPVDTPWNADIRERWADEFKGLSEDDADAFEELLGNLSQVNNLNDVGNVLGGVSPRARALYNTRVRGDLVKPDFGPGSMYEVGINASPDTFLDWDRPLSEQSEAVRRAYAAAASRGDPLMGELLGDLSDPAAMGLMGLFDRSAGSQAYNSLAPDAAEASRRLSEYGVNGIRYFDANSRGPGEIYNVGAPTDDFGPYSPYTSLDDATAQLEMLRRAGFDNAEIKTQSQPRASNYVVFNDALIKVLRKYGISALGLGVGGTGLMSTESEQLAPTGL